MQAASLSCPQALAAERTRQRRQHYDSAFKPGARRTLHAMATVLAIDGKTWSIPVLLGGARGPTGIPPVASVELR